MSKKKRLRQEKRQAARAVKPKVHNAPALDIAPGFWKRYWLPSLLMVVLPVLLYMASYQYGYVLDDVIVLSENKFVQKGVAGIGDILSNEVFTGYLGEQQDLVEGGRYRPLSLVSFAVEYEFFGADAGKSHLFNALWYGLVCLLIFRILTMLFPPGAEGNSAWYAGVPFAASLLYLLHPVHSEAVANIKGRDEIMTFFFALLALYATLKYLSGRKAVYLGLSAAAFFLGLLAKENALTFLAVIPLTVYTFTKADLKDHLKTILPLAVATLVYLVVRFQVVGYLLDSGKEVTLLMNNPFVEMTAGQKYATIFYTLWKYVLLLIFPHPLTHDYYPYQIPIIGWADWRSLVPFILYTGMGIYAVRSLRKRGNVVAYAILFYLFTLSITSNFVFSIGTFMNERFLFIPSLGYCILLAWLVLVWLPQRIGDRAWLRPASLALILLICSGYAYKTIDRVPAWENSFSLNQAAVKVSKNSARANNFMGYDYYVLANNTTDREQKREYLDLATPYIDRALEIYPKYIDALRVKAGLMGAYYQLDGDLGKLLDGFYSLLTVRHVPFVDTYLEYLNRRGYNPQMGEFYHKAGFELFAQTRGDYALATKYLNYGLQLKPDDARILSDLCVISYQQGQYQKAFQYGSQALKINPYTTNAIKYTELAREKLALQ